MNPDTELITLCETFDVSTLGDGDVNAGLNVVATMALTLSNLARKGSGVWIKDGKMIPVGCNLIASGSLTSNMILDEVVTPVSHAQDNLLSHVNRFVEDNQTEEKRKDRGLDRRWSLPDSPPANASENTMLQIMTGDPDLGLLTGTFEGGWKEVLNAPPVERFGDLVRCPRAFVTGATPGLLDQQLPGAHQGQLLAAIGLNRTSDVAKFSDICPSLMDGMIPAGPVGESVRGKLLITDPSNVLPMAAQAKGDKTAWLNRLIWLVDGTAGPELPAGEGNEGKVSLPNLNARFDDAVRQVLANRFNSHDPTPLIYKSDFAKRQARWMEFLDGMERQLPGISGTARCLLASLTFGLRRLVSAEKAPEGFKFRLLGIEALARHLIQRMANARTAILFSTEKALRLRDKRRLLNKLVDGPMEARDIYRSRHLSADYCKGLLTELMDDGCVKRQDENWGRIEGATLPEDSLHRALLEVS